MSVVEDRFAIMELLAEYATILDEKNFDGVFQVFADSVRWDFEAAGAGPASMMTPAEIKAWLLPGFTGFAATHHGITNHRIVIDRDHATIRAHFRAEHWIDPADASGGPTVWLATGFYDDQAVRTPHGWRLSSVRVTPTHSDGNEIVPIAMAVGERLLSASEPTRATERRATTARIGSSNAGLAKTANLRRDQRVALEVTSPSGRAWATAEGGCHTHRSRNRPQRPRSRSARRLLPTRHRRTPQLGRLPVSHGQRPTGPHDDERQQDHRRRHRLNASPHCNPLPAV